MIDSRYSDDHRARNRLWAIRPEIIHVHGQLGLYDPLDDSAMPYVAATSLDDLEFAQMGIRIITEMDPADEIFRQIELVLENAKRIFFLGFGFDKRNIRRLRYFPRELSDDVVIGGTKTGISNHDWGEIVDKVFQGGVNARAFDNSTIYNFLAKPGILG